MSQQPNFQVPPLPAGVPVLSYAGPAYGTPPGGAWRDGATVVLHLAGQLPHACVKCGQSSQTLLKRKLTWYSPLAYLGLLAGLLPFIIVALIIQKKATVLMPMCELHLKARRRALLFAWGIGLAGVAVGIAGPTVLHEPLLVVVGMLMFFAGIVFGQNAGNPLKPKKIDAQYAYLKGAGKNFLNQLPDLRAAVPM